MLFDDISFHDSALLEVKEDTFNQTIDFFLDFPTDWENNIFEKKMLRFSNVVFYLKKEFPFRGRPAILEINMRCDLKHTYNISPDIVTTSKYKAEIITNSGMRLIEFSNAELLNYP